MTTIFDNEIDYGTPAWGAKLICCTYSLVAIALSAPYFFDLGPIFLQYTTAVIAAVFILVALKPSNWRGWMCFKASNKGLYFPIKDDENAFFHVPWKNVGLIKQEKLYSQRQGITLELAISESDVETYFSLDDKANKLLGITNRRNGYFVMAYSDNAFQKVAEIVEALNALKVSDQ